MVYYKILFGVCLCLLLVSYIALAAAQKQGDQRRIRVLHLIRSGLSMSAISYLLRLMQTPLHAQLSLLIFVSCFLGTTFMLLGGREHWRLQAERRNMPLVLHDEEDESVTEAASTPFSGAGSSRLTARVHQVLIQAQYEAYLRQECCIDTDHLLLGLLHDSRSAGVHILDILGAGPEKVHLELLGQMASRRTMTKPTSKILEKSLPTQAGSPALTEGAQQVFALAAHEAYRFDEASVGTEHLLLGLVLVGKGTAASVLFQEGVTVEGIRNEVIKAKKAA